MIGRYRPEPVAPHTYDPEEHVPLKQVAKLCGESVDWAESRLPALPHLWNHSTGEKTVRRADISQWIEYAERERVQRR